MIASKTVMEIHYLDSQGLNKTQIARRLGIDRKTVRKYLKLGTSGPHRKPRRYRSILDPYKPYLQYRLERFPQLSAVELCFEISTERSETLDPERLLPHQPYKGSEKTVRRYLATIRPRSHKVTCPSNACEFDSDQLTVLPVDEAKSPECYNKVDQETLEVLRSLMTP